jgi:hypothetical protein
MHTGTSVHGNATITSASGGGRDASSDLVWVFLVRHGHIINGSQELHLGGGTRLEFTSTRTTQMPATLPLWTCAQGPGAKSPDRPLPPGEYTAVGRYAVSPSLIVVSKPTRIQVIP